MMLNHVEIPSSLARTSKDEAWSLIVSWGKLGPYSWPLEFREAGPVDPWQPPRTFGVTTKYLLVSIASPGPIRPPHQPEVGCPGADGPVV